MVELMIPLGVMPSLKAVQTMTGYSLGGSRLPFKPLSDEVATKLIAGIKALNIVRE